MWVQVNLWVTRPGPSKLPAGPGLVGPGYPHCGSVEGPGIGFDTKLPTGISKDPQPTCIYEVNTICRDVCSYIILLLIT